MNDLPRHTLARIIAEHGRGICDAPKRVEALLRDLCGAHRREINIITGALEERVAADLMAAGNSAVPRDALLARLAARLRDDLAYTPEAARWGVETWAVALGILSETELQMRAELQTRSELQAHVRAESAEASRSNRSNAPPLLPVEDAKPPAAASPPILRPLAPAPRRKPTPLPHVSLPDPPQQNIPPPFSSTPTARRGLTLRGCLLVIILAIVLIVAAVFVVPAVILFLREEQAKPSINEPRIR